MTVVEHLESAASDLMETLNEECKTPSEMIDTLVKRAALLEVYCQQPRRLRNFIKWQQSIESMLQKTLQKSMEEHGVGLEELEEQTTPAEEGSLN